ncbi:1-acyl-sn-glycerol-3-phosphate acyltransferase [Nannocystis exedens]|uniref:1-acyl-sn-glycerol-3-phosphate acyltransferase n=1 Tax=Nannocystis exedens TaxID=54 RepID=A0A1I1T0A4_9BACT|nr:lysophospholipid acyltransferase family protein [Nannocystis exedens]PCC66961.1 acyl-phosphate glycerol 3-phosphate acyltransferase [Nannocystis exedens]SFD50488.1 1-acyl-sn-glycerol-3-phosphate acyltransferase [Nannocystis exedens]
MPRTTAPRTILLSVWTYLLIFGLGGLAFCLQCVLAPLTWPFDHGRRITGRLFRLAAIGVTKLSPLWDFRVYQPLPPYRPRRTVVVSNHCSQTDPFLISHLPWEMKWLGKASLFKVPILGWAMFLAGDIPVVRGDRGSAKGAMARCRRYLMRDTPVMIFPEGTRALGDEMGPFKDGAFHLAIETGADILPMAVAGTAAALPKHDWRFGKARAYVAVGTPISTRGLTLDDLPALKDQVRAEIVALRQQIMPLTGP